MSIFQVSTEKMMLVGIPWVISGLVTAYFILREEKILDMPKLVMTLLVICGGFFSLFVYVTSTFQSFHFENPLYKGESRTESKSKEQPSKII
jgi:hypothetical protein